MTKDEQTIANLKKLKSVHNGSYGADIDRAVKALEQEQKTGKWIYDENGMDWNLAAWRCSECHVRNMNIPPNMIFGKNDVRKIANPLMFQGSKYCPNCGAKMNEEE